MDDCWEDSPSTIILLTLISNTEGQHNQIRGISFSDCVCTHT